MRRRLLIAAAASAAALAATYVVLVRTAWGQRWDDNPVFGRWPAPGSPFGETASRIDLAGTVLLVALAALVAALLLRRPPAAATVVLLAGAAAANLTTQVLKAVLTRPPHLAVSDLQPFPSGHTTAAASLGMVAVVLAPPARRTAVAAAAFLGTAGVGLGTVSAGWHRAGDVVGAALVALAWTALAAAFACGRAARRPGRGPAPRASALLGSALAVSTATVLGIVSVRLDAAERVQRAGGAAVSAHAAVQSAAAAVAIAACVALLARLVRDVDLGRATRG